LSFTSADPLQTRMAVRVIQDGTEGWRLATSDLTPLCDSVVAVMAGRQIADESHALLVRDENTSSRSVSRQRCSRSVSTNLEQFSVLDRGFK
jgi:hypothetical protein